MTDDELHARLSRAAREAFELRHDWRIVVREQERRFRALVAERTPRRADGSGGRR
jgi:hypothetical protein